jgi:uncharacterized protein (DUF1015 family)
MAILRSFRGYRPRKELAHLIASRPYDVLSSEEAREEARDNPYSFLHVVKPEIDLPPSVDPYSREVYLKGKENLINMIKDGIMVQDEKPCLYIYAQTYLGKTQYGIVGCASVLDYINNVIRKHELTRPDKEEDRKTHIRVTNFNAEPVFFAHPPHEELEKIVSQITLSGPEYDFVADDNIGHKFWVIKQKELIQRIEEIFATEIPFTYVADGHHRTAAAGLVGNERRHQDPKHTGMEEYNFFLAVLFPSDQLTILDYNRVVRDLNGLTPGQLLEKIRSSFDVMDKGMDIYRPSGLHNFSMYLEGMWYSLTAKKNTYKDSDPISRLDVSILSVEILDKVLGIADLRKSKKIDFVGGMRGLGELKARVDSSEMKVAFALYPVTMEQLMEIADTDNIMPPKTTWFEPKLRSGLVIHCLE